MRKIDGKYCIDLIPVSRELFESLYTIQELSPEECEECYKDWEEGKDIIICKSCLEKVKNDKSNTKRYKGK
jgi:hypothetical protein